MAMNRGSVFVLVVVASFCLWVCESKIVGGREDIPDFQHDKTVQDLAKFAAKEYNKKQNALLVYQKVVKAQRQVVEGMMYYLTIKVKDSGNKNSLYEAKIWVKSWQNFRRLEDFSPVNNTGGHA